MMSEQLRQLFKSAKPVPCGNTWETLSGEDQKRLCAECDRHVYNLAELSTQEFNEIQATAGKRMCVVFERKPAFWPVFAKPFAAIFTMLMLTQTAMAKEEEPPLFQCQTMMYTPMYHPPEAKCLDECGKATTRVAWMKKHPHDRFEGVSPDDAVKCKDKPKAKPEKKKGKAGCAKKERAKEVAPPTRL